MVATNVSREHMARLHACSYFFSRGTAHFRDHFVRPRFRSVWSQMQFLSRQRCRIAARGIAEFSWPTLLNFLSTPKIPADGQMTTVLHPSVLSAARNEKRNWILWPRSWPARTLLSPLNTILSRFRNCFPRIANNSVDLLIAVCCNLPSSTTVNVSYRING